MNKKNKQPLLPKLRFPEFLDAGDWAVKKLGQIGDILMCKRIFAKETNDTKGIPFFKIGTLGSNPDVFINKKLFDEYKSKYNFPRKGEILITCSGTVGKCLPYDGNDAYYQDSNIVWIDNPTLEISNEFVYYWLLNVNWGKLNSTTITRIYGSDLRNLSIVFPMNQREQQKIAACLSSLDDLITTGTQQLDALKVHKKGLMQKLFPAEGETVPKLRFLEFQDAGEWEMKKFDKIANFYKGKGVSKAEVDQQGKTPCIRYGELYTHYQEVINFIHSKTNVPESALFMSERNDVIIPSSGETKWDIATASCVMLDGVALGGDLNVIRGNQNGVFICYYLNGAKRHEVSKMAQGDTVVHLYSSQLKQLNILLPTKPEEQQKIAACLSSIDDLITAQSQKLDTLKTHKKGLMQQLFPNADKVGS